MNADPYATAFRTALRKDPLRQAARIAHFQARWLTLRRWRDTRLLARARRAGASVYPAPQSLRPPPHHYRNHRGPWIEDVFFRHWMASEARTELVYLPVFWTDFYLHVQTHRVTPGQHARFGRNVRAMLGRQLAAQTRCFTVLEYDHTIWDWHVFPKNVAVFGAGGSGDVPIPLLMGNTPFSCPPKSIPLSFVGQLSAASDATGVRSRMHAALQGHALFTSGPNWREIMADSVFSLCPRGLGRTSFRLYEALSVGSIPIYIWDDCPWLPYRDEIDWSEIAVSINVSDIASLPAMLAGYTPERIASMQRRIAELYDDYFTMDAACRQIVRMVEKLADRSRFVDLMRSRNYLPWIKPEAEIPDFLAE